jgi:glutamyl-tRNA reductase
MVLGEGQILAQVRDAHGWSTEQQLAHEVLHRAFDDAVACGKFVRSETKVSEGSVSVASAAVHLAKKIFSDLASQSVLLVGAGDTGARVARHMQLFGVRDLRVTNRTRSRAEKLARDLDAVVVPWAHLDEHLPEVSIVVTAVSSEEPILTHDRIREALAEAERRTLFLIDLAVPRNVSQEVSEIPGVFLYDVDDLHELVHDDEGHRQEEAEKAENLVDLRVDRFVEWYRARAAVPTVRDLRRWAETIRTSELEELSHKVDPQTYEALDRLSGRLMNKFLHVPTVGIRESAVHDGGSDLLTHVRRLFRLDDYDCR